MNPRLLLFGVLFVAFTFGVCAADPKEIEHKVTELNEQSIKVLGISLNALQYLVGASPNSYLLLSELERSGEVNYIRELEKKNYVKVQNVQGLPDGTQKSTKFLRIIPVGDGLDLQRCVVALKHNI